ncbi:MAG: HAMP domain-containing histidine kinase [Devosiaceae bacterium]|nr:HAMP domain-containing histidine kinase [Devosiaceae bacterium]
MGIEWLKSNQGARIIAYLGDNRPAWFCSIKGEKLLWSNPAARLFGAEQRYSNVKIDNNILPKEGQIKHLFELGSMGRKSLSRVSFIAGKNNISLTATYIPMQIDGAQYILIVGVDEIAKEILQEIAKNKTLVENLFADKSGFILLNKIGNPIMGTKSELELFDKRAIDFLEGFDENVTNIFLSERQENLLIFPKNNIKQEKTEQLDVQKADERQESPVHKDLTSLLDQLAADEELFTPLDEQDDEVLAQNAHLELPKSLAESENENTQDEINNPQQNTLYRIIGEGFETNVSNEKQQINEDAEQDDSKYNFAELSRVLNNRIGGDKNIDNSTLPNLENLNSNITSLNIDNKRTSKSSSLVNMPEEKQILNRLSLALLIFRDSEILFSNRSMADLLGHLDVASLKKTPLGDIFVKPEEQSEPVGPVTHLVRLDGEKVAINARLQSIIWNGSSALMLSANKNQEVEQENTNNDAEKSISNNMVFEFAKSLSKLEKSGVFRASRNGTLIEHCANTPKILDRIDDDLKKYPLSLMVGDREVEKLQQFLEKPARFAFAERPTIKLKAIDPNIEILLFSEGRAGIVTGYLGLIRRINITAPNIDNEDKKNIDLDIIKNISHALREPLTSIIGFSELIHSSYFGAKDQQRYIDYAKDINLSGQDILAIISELEEYALLNNKAYITNLETIDLGELLETCLLRIRSHANFSRVLIRSAISLKLPKIIADRKTLEQAILHLLANAIEQTPVGGQIIVSANCEIDDSINIYVRDTGSSESDYNKSFVLFSENIDKDRGSRKANISNMGLALTRSLLEVNSVSLEIDQTNNAGTLSSLIIPANMAIK